MEITQIKMYELLKDKIGSTETEAFIFIIEEKMDAKINQRKHELATKEDISLLKSDITSLRGDFASLRGDFTSLRGDFTSLKDDFAELRLATTKDIASVRQDMMSMRTELIRTIFVASLAQLVTIVACVISLVLLFVKK